MNFPSPSFERGCLQFAAASWLVVAMSCVLAADETRVTLLDADGRESSGWLQAISHDFLSITRQTSVNWKWSDVVWLRFERQVDNASDQPRGSAIWLANGDRLVARGIGIEDEQLRAVWRQFPEWPEFQLPLESVRGLSLSLPQARERRDEIAAWLFDRKEARDELRLFNGDVLSGEVTGWRAESITLKSGGADVRLLNTDIRDIRFNPELLMLSPPKELCWLVSLKDGSRVTIVAAKSRVVGETLRAVHVSGVSWEIPLGAIAELRVLHGRAVFLSDVAPLEAKHTPFLPDAREWPLQQDRSASGRPLRLKGREFPKGLGMHSRTTVTYDLAEKFRVFQAVVGLDDTTIGDGTAKCAVDVDGRRVFEPPALTRLQGPVRLPNIDVSGAKRLTLTVDFGELGDSQDQVNWGDAVLLR